MLGLGLGWPTRVFDPAALFAGGVAGAWYDPSDLATMFQDAAGTVPAAVDGPVGRILDKSGRGNHAVQATGAARPTLRQDGDAHPYLEFDGVDDHLAAAFPISRPWDRISAIRHITITDLDRVFGAPNSAGGNLMQRPLAGGGLALSDGVFREGPALPLGTTGVVTERHAGASSRIAVNNGAYVNGDIGTNEADGITLGARGAAVQAGNVRIYGVLMIGRPLDDVETGQVRRFMAAKGGVQL